MTGEQLDALRKALLSDIRDEYAADRFMSEVAESLPVPCPGTRNRMEARQHG